jgi:hypothetical protein
VLWLVSHIEEPQVGVEVEISGSRQLVLKKRWGRRMTRESGRTEPVYEEVIEEYWVRKGQEDRGL